MCATGNIGENIRKFRKKANLTQKELAEKCGLAEITIRQYETGKRTPKTEILAKIADALGLQCRYTAGGVPYFCDSEENIRDDSKRKKFNQAQFSDAMEYTCERYGANAQRDFINQEFKKLSESGKEMPVETYLKIVSLADSFVFPKELIPLKNIYQHLDETEKDIFLECISKIGKLNVEGKKEILKLADVFSESEKYKRVDGLAELIKELEPGVTKLVPTFGSEKDVVAQNIQESENKKE